MGRTIIQYIHRPNATELGQGNTHETYMLINSKVDLTSIFPIGIEVEVTDVTTKNIYRLRSASGREFRVNQLGEYYRDKQAMFGDEIVFTCIIENGKKAIFIDYKKRNAVAFNSYKYGYEVVNIDRLASYQTTPKVYTLQTEYNGENGELQIAFEKNDKKRSDSPDFTEFYSLKINGKNIDIKDCILYLGSKNRLTSFEKYSFNKIDMSGIEDGNIATPPEPISIDDAPSSTLQYLTAIRTKPFLLLAGISGTGKSQIVRKLAQATDNIDTFATEEERWNCHKPANFELIQVKPNWHNSMDVVGYKSNIGGAHYEFTQFVEFVAKAWHHQGTPFFLCLDEMNLAPVEEYFAEYLSAIESRSYEDEYETDPIIKPFSSFGEDMCEEMIKHLVNTSDPKLKADLMSRFALKGLTLPPNLIVMGTVNMDETTFSFSRKVLDRAMSIEMNEVNMANCIHRNAEQQVPVLIDMNKRLVDRAIKSVEVIEGNPESKEDEVLLSNSEADEIVSYLEKVNTLLEGTPFKLGYRACNEALLYARACKELKRDMARGIDEFTMMKILSRLEGDDAKLAIEENDARIESLGFTKSDVMDSRYNDVNILSCLRAIIKPVVAEGAESIKKIDEMNAILHRDHFVSYWG